MSEVSTKCCWPMCNDNRKPKNSYCGYHSNENHKRWKARGVKNKHAIALNKELTTIEIENFVPKQNDMDENFGYLPITWGEESNKYWATRWSSENWKFNLGIRNPY